MMFIFNEISKWNHHFIKIISISLVSDIHEQQYRTRWISIKGLLLFSLFNYYLLFNRKNNICVSNYASILSPLGVPLDYFFSWKIRNKRKQLIITFWNKKKRKNWVIVLKRLCAVCFVTLKKQLNYLFKQFEEQNFRPVKWLI